MLHLVKGFYQISHLVLVVHGQVRHIEIIPGDFPAAVSQKHQGTHQSVGQHSGEHNDHRKHHGGKNKDHISNIVDIGQLF